MSTPLTANCRIVIPYTVVGFSHKIEQYVKNAQVVGGSYNINTRATDANDLVWTDAAVSLAGALSPICATATTFGQARLEKLVGNVWTPLAFGSVSNLYGGGTYIPSSQVTITLRDTANHKVRWVVMESAELPAQHSISPTAGDSNMDSVIQKLTTTGGATPTPWDFVVSRANLYLNASAFVSFSVDYNRKLRRKRGN